MSISVHYDIRGLKLSRAGIAIPTSTGQAIEIVKESLLFQRVSGLRKRLRVVIAGAERGRHGKDELLLLLHSVLTDYRDLPSGASGAYRIAINNFIIGETETLCSIYLSAGELIKLWRSIG